MEKQPKKESQSKTQKEKSRTGLLTQLLLLVLLLFVGAHLLSVQKKLDEASAEMEALSAQVEAQQRENDTLSSALEKSDDEDYLRQLARERLDMVTPGERVFYDVSN